LVTLHFSKVIHYFILLLEKVICYCNKIRCSMLLPNTAFGSVSVCTTTL